VTAQALAAGHVLSHLCARPHRDSSPRSFEADETTVKFQLGYSLDECTRWTLFANRGYAREELVVEDGCWCSATTDRCSTLGGG